MPAKIERRKILKETERIESTSDDKLFGVLPEQSESEIKWVQLHQMFDR